MKVHGIVYRTPPCYFMVRINIVPALSRASDPDKCPPGDITSSNAGDQTDLEHSHYSDIDTLWDNKRSL